MMRVPEPTSDGMGLLGQIESGELSVDDVLRVLEGKLAPPTGVETDTQHKERRFPNWWLIPFTIGSGLFAGGFWLATIGSWWWLLAAPLLLGGGLIAFISLISARSPWLHVRITRAERTWPRKVGISLPVPAALTAHVIRLISPLLEERTEAIVASQLLLALEQSGGEFLYVDVVDEETGDHIEAFLG